MTASSDPNWMLLFLDTDLDHKTGWQGYDLLINAEVVSSDTTTVKRTTGGWNWRTVARVAYQVRGNEMELQVPLSVLGGDAGARCVIDFHWADNIRRNDDIVEFAVSGDSAPNRRFNYRWRAP